MADCRVGPGKVTTRPTIICFPAENGGPASSTMSTWCPDLVPPYKLKDS